MASPGKGARIKGAQFERDIATILTEGTGLVFKRGLGQTRGGEEVSDVTCEHLPEIHIECKRRKRCDIKGAIKQAIEDIAASSNKDKWPIAITKEDRQDILVTMPFDYWLLFFKAWIADANHLLPTETTTTE